MQVFLNPKQSSSLRVQVQSTRSSSEMLLKLPREMRNMIYHFTYQSPHNEHSSTPDIYGTRYCLDNPLGRTKDPSPIMIIRKSSTSLLRTCKQVNAEAIDVLYGANTFTFAETMHPVAVESDLASPNESRLRRRDLLYDGMNDLIQMADFFDHIGASNRAKIRHIKLEINVHSLFLGYVPFPSHYTGYFALGTGGILDPGGKSMCDAINMRVGARGSLASFGVSGSRNKSNT